MFPGLPSAFVSSHAPIQGLLSAAMDRTEKFTIADNTKRSYLAAWQGWDGWARRYGVEPLPVEPRAFVAYLEWMLSRGRTARTLQHAITSISRIDAYARSEGGAEVVPLRQHPLVRNWRRAAERSTPGAEGAPLITTAQLLNLLRGVDGYAGAHMKPGPRRTAHALRMRAMMLVSYYGACRRSELIAFNVGDVERTDRGIALRFARSKTDQTAIGETRDILPQGDAELCPVFAWEAWLAVHPYGSTPDAPAFVSLPSGTRMVATNWYKQLWHLGKKLGIKVSPHSFRVAFATHAAELHESDEVAYHGRWRGGSSTVARYIRRGRGWKKNPTAGLSEAGRAATREKSEKTS